MKLSHFLIVATIVTLADAQCSVDSECKVKVENVKTLLNTFSNSIIPPALPMLKILESLCYQARNCSNNCLGSFDCEAISTRLYEIDTECIIPVLKAIYSGKTPCTRTFNFFSISETSKRRTYANGKECFLKVAKNVCWIIHAIPLAENYDKIMDLYTMAPESKESCNTPFFKFQKLQCEAMKDGLSAKLEEMSKMGNPKEEKVVKVLNDAKDCQEKTSCENGKRAVTTVLAM